MDDFRGHEDTEPVSFVERNPRAVSPDFRYGWGSSDGCATSVLTAHRKFARSGRLHTIFWE